MPVDVVLPKVDMDMESGVIAAWKVAEGAAVRQGDILFDMETSKSIMEVEAPASGVIRGLAPVDGASLPVGTVVARIDTGSDAAAAEPRDDSFVRASPYARTLAREHGVDLHALTGTGPHGRVVAQDVTTYADARGTSAHADSHLVPFTPTRRTAARRLAESARTIPHFYMTAHVDMTALRAEIARVGRGIARATRTKPTTTLALALIVARVLTKHPLLNASVEGEAARLHDAVHIGIAMDRDGDLYVPVLRDAHARTLADSTAEFRRLRDAVRSRSVTAADLRGATFTLSSLDTYGVDAYTAIIDPPQSAILAVGRTVDTPVGRDGAIVLRPLATLSLSSDHRIVDGLTAARFMADLRRAIENPGPLEEMQ